MNALWLVGLGATCLLGLVLTVFQLPGNWLILAGAVGYAWHGQWSTMPRWVLYAVALMAVAGEAVEFVSSAWLARRVGASRRAAWYALAGGFLGMFVFSIPIPVIGTIAGVVLGCFCGAVLGEMTLRNDWAGAARVGLGAAAGRALGTVGKLTLTLLMAVLVMGAATWHAIPQHWLPDFLSSSLIRPDEFPGRQHMAFHGGEQLVLGQAGADGQFGIQRIQREMVVVQTVVPGRRGPAVAEVPPGVPALHGPLGRIEGFRVGHVFAQSAAIRGNSV